MHPYIIVACCSYHRKHSFVTLSAFCLLGLCLIFMYNTLLWRGIGGPILVPVKATATSRMFAESSTTLPRENSVVTNSFIPNKPKFVLLLAQQRTGSSFAGAMFDRNPAMMYVYEPLDALYVHLYGVQSGWTVPNNIHFYWNGTHRPVPNIEMKSVNEFLDGIFNCNFKKLPTEFLVSSFWHRFQQTEAEKYKDCLQTHNVTGNDCHGVLSDVCETKFGENPTKHEYCSSQLNKAKVSEMDEPFMNYTNCLNKQRDIVFKYCVPKLHDLCQSKSVRVIKTVRLNVETVKPLIEKYDNFKIIHLIRDPRSVIASRLSWSKNWAIHGATPLDETRALLNSTTIIADTEHLDSSVIYNTSSSLNGNLEWKTTPYNGIVRETRFYCSDVLQNMLDLQRIETLHLGTTYQLIYDRMTYKPTEELNHIYEFLREPLPNSIELFIKNETGHPAYVRKWQRGVSLSAANVIDRSCVDLYHALDFQFVNIGR